MEKIFGITISIDEMENIEKINSNAIIRKNYIGLEDSDIRFIRAIFIIAVSLELQHSSASNVESCSISFGFLG